MTIAGRHLLIGCLAAVCVGLGFAIDQELRIGRDPGEPELGISVEASHPSIRVPRTGFTMAPPDTFAEIERRPLFFRARRPPLPATPSKEVKPKPPPTLVLQGIVISPESNSVILRSARSSSIERFKEGEAIEGWLVKKILPGRIMLTSGERVQEILLDIKGSSSAAVRISGGSAERSRTGASVPSNAGGAGPPQDSVERGSP